MMIMMIFYFQLSHRESKLASKNKNNSCPEKYCSKHLVTTCKPGPETTPSDRPFVLTEIVRHRSGGKPITNWQWRTIQQLVRCRRQRGRCRQLWFHLISQFLSRLNIKTGTVKNNLPNPISKPNLELQRRHEQPTLEVLTFPRDAWDLAALQTQNLTKSYTTYPTPLCWRSRFWSDIVSIRCTSIKH